VNGTEKISLAELAELTGGELEGDGGVEIHGVCSIDRPRAGYIALALAGARFDWADALEIPAALIASGKIKGIDLPLIIHDDPRLAFTIALRHFHPDVSPHAGVSPGALVADEAKVDPTASVGPFAVIENDASIGAEADIGAGCYIGANSVIGEKTKLYPNVTVLHDVIIGARCIIHSGVVIGSDGFGFTPTAAGNLKVPQIGKVIIGNDVEIGANCTIDRATLDETVIADDVKIDNLVQVAHNVKIGPHTRIAAQAGISGRAIIEGNVVIAGQAGFQNGIRVGEGSMIAGQAGVTRNVPPGSRVSGYPARDHRDALRLLAAQNRLPEIIERLDAIEKQLESRG
jgi:UDP-3-O-[3-hydroxymyristoyl] glucosamine N-acyltransferase